MQREPGWGPDDLASALDGAPRERAIVDWIRKTSRPRRRCKAPRAELPAYKKRQLRCRCLVRHTIVFSNEPTEASRPGPAST